MSALDLENLLIEYRHKDQVTTAVDHISFAIKEGEFFGLLGPNGAGKTSIISAITSLVNFQEGSIRVLGRPAGTLEAKRVIGFVPQELVSYGFFNVNEVLNFASGYFGIRNNQAKIDELLERLQLGQSKYKLVSQLSGGQKRRLLIAKALLHSPRILLLDEPSAGVDVELRTILWNFAIELNQEGMTILLTTHYLEEAERLCQRVAIMDKGKLLVLDETKNIMANAGKQTLESAFLKLIKLENGR
jgi:ABC-2 type transport system ATP-binding protein